MTDNNEVKELEEIKDILEDNKEEVVEINKSEVYEDLLTKYIKILYKDPRNKNWVDASQLIVYHLVKTINFYSIKDDDKKELWFYNSDLGIYKNNGISEIKKIMYLILEKHYTTYIANLVLDKILVSNFIDSDKFFNINYIDEVAVNNGILNIKTKELSEFTSDKIFFNKLPMDFNPECRCPQIVKFVTDIVETQEEVNSLFEFFGYCLHKDYPIKKSLMCVGDADNAKTQLLTLYKKFVNPVNVSFLSLHKLCLPNPDFDYIDLHNKFINIAPDIGNEDISRVGIFKSLTGNDSITIPRKFKNSITIKNYAKFIFACNELPEAYDSSDGFWSRWVLITFPFKFLNKELMDPMNKNHKSKIENIVDKISSDEELSGLLNLALESLKHLLIKKDFSKKTSAKELKDCWKRISNNLFVFIDDNCKIGGFDEYVTKESFREYYTNWCRKTGQKRNCNDRKIKETLEYLGIGDGRKSIGEFREYCWLGISLKNKVVGELEKY